MKRLFFCCIASISLALAATPADIKLPPPDKNGGRPLMRDIVDRQSLREITGKPLSQQQISDILFAAAGVTRSDGKRTTPSARNVMDTTVLAIMPAAAYEYVPATHSLKLLLAGDHREATGELQAHLIAPLVLVYISDQSKFKGVPADQKDFYAGAHVGAVFQNVYLIAADRGLATVVCASLEREELALRLKLPEHYKVLLSQPIGYAR